MQEVVDEAYSLDMQVCFMVNAQSFKLSHTVGVGSYFLKCDAFRTMLLVNTPPMPPADLVVA